MAWGADRQSCCVVPPPPLLLLPPAASHQQRPAAAGITDDYLLQCNRLISKSSGARRRYQAAASAAVHSEKLTACSTWQLGKSSVGGLGMELVRLAVVLVGRGSVYWGRVGVQGVELFRWSGLRSVVVGGLFSGPAGVINKPQKHFTIIGELPSFHKHDIFMYLHFQQPVGTVKTKRRKQQLGLLLTVVSV